MRGFYLMHRGWLDHPALGGSREPYCRRSAWAWLIENAAYREYDIWVAGRQQHISRGQLSTSLRKLGQQWGWSEPKVRRFLRVLVECSMIVCVADAGQTLVSICNYDHYQESGCVGDAASDAAATQQRRSSDAAEDKKGNQGKEGELPPPIVPPPSGANNGRRKPKLLPFPVDWLPDERDAKFALDHGRDYAWIDREGPKCRDHHIAKGNRFADLHAAWRTWVRNAEDFAPRGPRSNGFAGSAASQPGPVAAAMRAVLSRRDDG